MPNRRKLTPERVARINRIRALTAPDPSSWDLIGVERLVLDEDGHAVMLLDRMARELEGVRG